MAKNVKVTNVGKDHFKVEPIAQAKTAKGKLVDTSGKPLDPQKQFDAFCKTMGHKSFKLSKGQIAMIEDGAPLSSFIEASERKDEWAKNPPKPTPAFNHQREEDADVKMFREAEERQRETKKRERLQALKDRQPPREKRPERPAGTFTIAEWAIEKKLDPRKVRGAARSVKEEVIKLQVNPQMKYVFPEANKAKLEALITTTLTPVKKGESIARKPRQREEEITSLPPASETVWSGNAKKNNGTAPPKGPTNIIDKKREQAEPFKKAKAVDMAKLRPSQIYTACEHLGKPVTKKKITTQQLRNRLIAIVGDGRLFIGTDGKYSTSH